MTRRRTGKLVVEQALVPDYMADEFRRLCAALGKPRSTVLRAMIERWLRSQRAMERRRAAVEAAVN